MATYKGFSTKSFKNSDPLTIVGTLDNDFGPYTLTDKDLIVMDLINHFNIRKIFFKVCLAFFIQKSAKNRY